MNPIRVTATNWGPYERVDWEIPSGLTAILGVNMLGDGANSNGAGKTMLLELVPVALFGPTLPWSEHLTSGSPDGSCSVELEFEHAGDRYRVRRTFDARGRGKTSLDFEREHQDKPGRPSGEGWKSLTCETQAETQRLIEQTIGLSQATFAHSVFAAQGHRHFADPSLPPRERKAILAEAIGLEVWDELLAAVRADVKDTQTDLDKIAARLGAFEEDLARKPELEEQHETLIASAYSAAAAAVDAENAEKVARAALDDAEHAAKGAEAAQARLRSATAAVDSLVDQVRKANEAQEVYSADAAVIDTVEAKAAQADELTARLAELRRRDGDRESARRAVDVALTRARDDEGRSGKLRTEADQLDQATRSVRQKIEDVLAHVAERCDRCNQTLGAEAREEAIASLTRDAEAYELRASQLREEAQAIALRAEEHRAEAEKIVVPDPVDPREAQIAETLEREARQASSEAATIRERMRSNFALYEATETREFADRHAAAHRELQDAKAAVDATPASDSDRLSELRREAERRNTELVIARQDAQQAAAAVAASEERLRNLLSLAERSQEAILARAGLTGRLDNLKALERAYGRDGIPALVMEATAIPQLEREAQRVLEELDMPFRIELVTQRENKGGGMKDTLDVIVHEPNGARRYETYSGGESTRLELALRIALARMIAHRRSDEIGLLALDEPAFLDTSGMGKVAEVLRGLTEFRAIVLVSHDERLVDSFDQTVTVIRDESGSRIEEAA